MRHTQFSRETYRWEWTLIFTFSNLLILNKRFCTMKALSSQALFLSCFLVISTSKTCRFKVSILLDIGSSLQHDTWCTAGLLNTVPWDLLSCRGKLSSLVLLKSLVSWFRLCRSGLELNSCRDCGPRGRRWEALIERKIYLNNVIYSNSNGQNVHSHRTCFTRFHCFISSTQGCDINVVVHRITIFKVSFPSLFTETESVELFYFILIMHQQ